MSLTWIIFILFLWQNKIEEVDKLLNDLSSNYAALKEQLLQQKYTPVPTLYLYCTPLSLYCIPALYILHLVELVNLGKNGEQPFDVGTVITLMAQPTKGQVRGQQAGFYPGYATCVLPFGHFNGSEKWERLN